MADMGDLMRQLAMLTVLYELLNALWDLADASTAKIDGVSVSHAWMGVNLDTLTQRLNYELSEERATCDRVQTVPTK
ncbi:hypothetical protein IWQ57_004580 [Coemansia nantahalensis]|uniref:Uncharacterized protein n=1 Tax=Coemansia nantahalensis TaxID=2789366 RepID=A0ACC1JRN8_9FUNG|nr:hypothetical protein IWQ57_004580 [Coemansia nantahalensis]